MKSDFINAIESNDIHRLRAIPKTDFHLHASRSCEFSDFAKHFRLRQKEQREKFEGFHDMELWVKENIHPYVKDRVDWEMRIILMFLAQKKDSVKIYEPSFTIRDVMRYDTVNDFIMTIDCLHKQYYPESDFRPCLSLSRRVVPHSIQKRVEEYLATQWFKSIDLCNDEKIGDISSFKEIYKTAQKYGVMRKAHIGECSSAQDIVHAINILELDEVQHGISIIENAAAIRYVKERETLFNVCPASNIIMGIIKNYAEHPIKKMYQEGLMVSINTDDLLVFNQNISTQLMLLYQNGVFSPFELEEIQKTGFERRKREWKEL